MTLHYCYNYGKDAQGGMFGWSVSSLRAIELLLVWWIRGSTAHVLFEHHRAHIAQGQAERLSVRSSSVRSTSVRGAEGSMTMRSLSRVLMTMTAFHTTSKSTIAAAQMSVTVVRRDMTVGR